ncbi:MAG: GGDEF domain-containing protein [Pirellulales bacterium]|nr:GGDEF domain-containing protein [Pirellulales bacterium]
MAWILVAVALLNLAVGIGVAVYLGVLPARRLVAQAQQLRQSPRNWGAALAGRLRAGIDAHSLSWLLSRWTDEVMILAQRCWALLSFWRQPRESEEAAKIVPVAELIAPYDTLRETLAVLDSQLADSAENLQPQTLVTYRETLESAHQRWIAAGKQAAAQLQQACTSSALPEETARSLESTIQEHLEAIETLLIDLGELDTSKPVRARAILRGSVVNLLELSQDLMDRLLCTLAAADQAPSAIGWPAKGHLDPLTGLPNMRGLESWLQPRRARPAAAKGLAGVLVYVDALQTINRKWGVHVGDRVLVEVARLVRKSARPPRLAARICGPQFLLLLPVRSLAFAQRLAEQLRRRIEALQLTGMPEPPSVTATCVAALCDATQPADAMVRQLHRALYERDACEPNQTWVLKDGAMRLVSARANEPAAGAPAGPV